MDANRKAMQILQLSTEPGWSDDCIAGIIFTDPVSEMLAGCNLSSVARTDIIEGEAQSIFTLLKSNSLTFNEMRMIDASNYANDAIAEMIDKNT